MREELIKIFNDTKEHIMNNNMTLNTTKLTNDSIILPNKRYDEYNIEVINLDSVSTICEYSKLGKTCLLNMASYKRPGGGVRNGAMAGEESLFRCSNLSLISEDFYPLLDNECLYTNVATFFKDFNYNYMEDINSDVITIAALNLNTFYSPSDYYEITMNKIRLMLSSAIINNVHNIILGAWRCGVFKNDPIKMSQMFREVLIDEGYSYSFKNVIFGIINDHNSMSNNYNIFKRMFN